MTFPTALISAAVLDHLCGIKMKLGNQILGEIYFVPVLWLLK